MNKLMTRKEAVADLEAAIDRGCCAREILVLLGKVRETHKAGQDEEKAE